MANVNPKMRSRARLTVVHPQAAGIDIGSRFHVVAVPAELDDEPVRTLIGWFPRTTAALLLLTDNTSLLPSQP
jgi:hypothetical protein